MGMKITGIAVIFLFLGEFGKSNFRLFMIIQESFCLPVASKTCYEGFLVVTVCPFCLEIRNNVRHLKYCVIKCKLEN